MKTFLGLAWRRSADEKIPLSSKNGVLDNGAISKADTSKVAAEKAAEENMASCKADDSNLSRSDKLVNSKAIDSDSSTSESQPMSLLRKFAMFLSFDIIALYFAAFAWLIPCRLLQCYFGKEWTVNLDNVSISTNMEVNGPLGTEFLLFGHYGENMGDLGVTALISSTGSVKWKIPVDFPPTRCHCKAIDVNGDGVLDCLIFGYDHLLALNASDGHVFWTRNFEKISLLIASVSDCEKEGTKWIAVLENKGPEKEYIKDIELKERISLVILEGRNGSLVRDLPLYCDSFPKQLVTWKSKMNVTHIAFQCTYNGRAEVQLISEEELCGLILGRNMPYVRDFSLLFSFGSSTTVDDVFLLPLSRMGLVVGWSTMVAMATDARSPPHLLWQITSGSIRSAINFLCLGRFTSRNSVQIAVVIHTDSSNVIKIINVPDGDEVASIDLGSGRVISCVPVSRKTKNIDSLLITKEGGNFGASLNLTAEEVIDFTTESSVLRQDKVYLLLTAEKEINVTELLTESRTISGQRHHRRTEQARRVSWPDGLPDAIFRRTHTLGAKLSLCDWRILRNTLIARRLSESPLPEPPF